MWSPQSGEFIPRCGADIVVSFCNGNVVSGIRQMGFELDLDVMIDRI